MNVLLLSASLMPGVTCGADLEPAAPRKAAVGKGPRVELDWVELEEGLKVLRKEYRPLALRYLPAPPAEGAPNGAVSALRDLLRVEEVEKELQNFVCVELSAPTLAKPYPVDAAPPSAVPSPPQPPRGGASPSPPGPPEREAVPSASVRLRLVEGVPALLILDFRERVVRRYQEKLPAPAALRKELAALARELRSQAVEARRVEKILEESKYSHALGEPRQAVLTILPLDDARARRGLDRDLAERVEAVLAKYRKEGQSLLATGEALESEKRYLEASEVYRRAARTYPFPELVRTANRRQSEALRKERGGL